MNQIKKLDDDGKLRRRWYNKRSNAAKLGIGFNLSFEEFCGLITEAGIKSSALGHTGYHLARYNDAGDYVVGNCRFIPFLENVAEKKPTDKVRAAARRNLVLAQAAPKDMKRAAALRFARHGLPAVCLPLSPAELKRRKVLLRGLDPKAWGFVTRAAEALGVTHPTARKTLISLGLR